MWRALPANPAACTSLPADWKEASGLLGKVADAGADSATAIGDQLTGPAAVCWYAKSTLVAPVFVARVKTQDATSIAALKTALGKTFGDVIGAYEAKAAKSGDADAGYRRLPVTTQRPGRGRHRVATAGQRALRYGVVQQGVVRVATVGGALFPGDARTGARLSDFLA